MINVNKSFPALEKLLTDPTVSKKQLMELLWLAEHPEYEEKIVGIREFIDSPEYLNCKEECWEPIKEDLEGLFQGYDDPLMNWKYNEACFDEGIGGGKSYKASHIITYMLYRTLILREPQKFFHLAKGSGIYFMNMSINAEQAKKVVFVEINSRISNSTWFKERGYLPDPNVKSELRFAKNINILPGNSKESFPMGYNLLGAVMDEAAHYKETESHYVAEEMFNALYNRIKHRFRNKGMLVMISSPLYADDFVEKKMEEAKTNPRIFSKRRTSWESKPKDMFSGKTFEKEGHIIPIEFEIEANRNFERFKRDIMAIPSLVIEPYFKQMELARRQIDLNLKHPLDQFNRYFPWFKGNPNHLYCMHIDLSFNTCRTGMGLAHRQGDKIIVDMMAGISPPTGGEIDYEGIENMVLSLRERGFHIGLCSYDSYQSQGSIQRLNKKGIKTELLSIDKNMQCYETLKEGIYSGKIILYDYPCRASASIGHVGEKLSLQI